MPDSRKFAKLLWDSFGLLSNFVNRFREKNKRNERRKTLREVAPESPGYSPAFTPALRPGVVEKGRLLGPASPAPAAAPDFVERFDIDFLF